MTNVIHLHTRPSMMEDNVCVNQNGDWQPVQGVYKPPPYKPPPSNFRRLGKLLWNAALLIVFLGIIWPVVWFTLVALAM